MTGPTLEWDQALSAYLQSLVKRKMREARSRLRRFIRFAEPAAPLPTACTAVHVTEWSACLCDSGVKSGTVRAYVGSVRSFLRWLHVEGVIELDLTPNRRLPAATGWADALADYLHFVEHHKGLHGPTNSFPTWLRRFTRQIEAVAPRPCDCTVSCLDGWLIAVSESGVRGSTVRHYVNAVRLFLRWLHDEGHLPIDVASHLESPITWRDGAIPSHFTWSELEQLVKSIQPITRRALRHRALLWLFASCGLRAGEVARLRLDDVDITACTVRVRQRKTKDWLLMPLSRQAADAIEEYIERGRPSSPHTALFLTSQGQPYRCGSSLSSLVRLLADRAGLGRERGAQAIRRAVGTRLVERGATVGQVALMLGHDGLQSAGTYVRVSMQMLAEVADNYGELL